MRIRWTPAAAADSQRISDYLKEHHPNYRQPTIRKLSVAVLGARAVPPTPYVAVFPREQATEVTRIYHAAQDRP
jgi:hypothetical protein